MSAFHVCFIILIGEGRLYWDIDLIETFQLHKQLFNDNHCLGIARIVTQNSSLEMNTSLCITVT